MFHAGREMWGITHTDITSNIFVTFRQTQIKYFHMWWKQLCQYIFIFVERDASLSLFTQQMAEKSEYPSQGFNF